MAISRPQSLTLPLKLCARCQQVLDLNTMSAEDIAAAARATVSADPFAARLPDPPGVRRSRQAFITGASLWRCSHIGHRHSRDTRGLLHGCQLPA